MVPSPLTVAPCEVASRRFALGNFHATAIVDSVDEYRLSQGSFRITLT
jgi:hypothetical protein